MARLSLDHCLAEAAAHSRLAPQHRVTAGGREAVGRLVLNTSAPKPDRQGAQPRSALAISGHDGVAQLLARSNASCERGLVGPDHVSDLLASSRVGGIATLQPSWTVDELCLGSTLKDHASAPWAPTSSDWVDRFLAREAEEVSGSAKVGGSSGLVADGHAAIEVLKRSESALTGHAELLQLLPDPRSASSDDTTSGASSQPERRRLRSADGRAAVAKLRSQHRPPGGTSEQALLAAETSSPPVTARRRRPPPSGTESILADADVKSGLHFPEVKPQTTETQHWWNCTDF